MPREIIYKCCICHRVLDPYDTIRVIKQLYHVTLNGGHAKVDQHDFCPRCYSKIDNWIQKHKEEDINVD